jgi:hypothetical protein
MIFVGLVRLTHRFFDSAADRRPQEHIDQIRIELALAAFLNRA